MFDITTGQWNFNSPVAWIDLGCAILIGIFLIILTIKALSVKRSAIIFASLYGLLIVSWFFGLTLLFTIFEITILLLGLIVIMINIGALRKFSLINIFKRSQKETTKVFNRSGMYKEISDAVVSLSKQKIGAIITMERNVKLDDVMKSGTIINAPVTSELLMTIFYPGTRLHDGACIVRGDRIYAASVYFTPTTRPLTGKYGSRHRAAIGISEVCDAVTIIVSEETGRISLAIGGELTPVPVNEFNRVFEETMNESSNQK